MNTDALVGVWHAVKQIFTMPVNLQFSLHALHCLTSYKRLETTMCAIGAVQLCITKEVHLRKSRGDKTQDVLSTSKSRGTCLAVHPWIYAHGVPCRIRCEGSVPTTTYLLTYMQNAYRRVANYRYSRPLSRHVHRLVVLQRRRRILCTCARNARPTVACHFPARRTTQTHTTQRRVLNSSHRLRAGFSWWGSWGPAHLGSLSGRL